MAKCRKALIRVISDVFSALSVVLANLGNNKTFSCPSKVGVITV